MTSPADKATDDVRGLVERLLEPCVDWNGEQIVDDSAPRHEVHCRLLREAAATLTSLLERAERAERRAEELADGLMYVTIDHTGCIYTTADEDRAIKLAKDNLAAAIEAERTARERAEARIKELEQERDALLDALTPSALTKADYIGEFQFSIEDRQEDEDGEMLETTREVTVPWTTIKEIMAAIRARAVKGE